MSEQHGRKRDPWKLPGEGTGVYGVDPLVFLKPGDNAEVDELLEELRTDCDEGDPFFVDYKKRKRKVRAPANRQGGEGGAREAKGKATARKGGVSPRWLGFATVAIVGPAVTLLLVMLLSSRRPAAGEAARAKEEPANRRAPELAAASVPVVAPAERPLVLSTAASGADIAPVPAAMGAPIAGGPRVSSAPSRARKTKEDPYEGLFTAAPSASPSASPPAIPIDMPENRAPNGAPGFEKPEAEF